MAVSSPRRALLAAVFLGFLLGAATSIRTATFSSSQVRYHQRRRLVFCLCAFAHPPFYRPSLTRGLCLQNLAEDKSRLGSTPPSCRNRCSACNPCTPVQVTTVPGLGGGARVTDDTVAGFSRYSNYKPLWWKCRCDGRLYDP